MSSSSTAPSIEESVQRYPLHTYSIPRPINFKQATDQLYPAVVDRVSPDCMILHVGRNEKVFIFKFGAVVFLNVPTGAHENYLKRLQVVPEQRPPTGSEWDDYAEDEVFVRIEPGVTDVSFNTATIPEFNLVTIQLIAQVLAQSSALELIEWEVEDYLARSEELTRFFKGNKLFKKPKRQKILQFIGDGLNAKHRIINQLVLFNEPEKTWEKEDLWRIYSDLYSNFDIRDRLEKIDKMLRLYNEVSELILSHVNAQRSEMLEWIIIALITFEIVQSLLG